MSGCVAKVPMQPSQSHPARGTPFCLRLRVQRSKRSRPPPDLSTQTSLHKPSLPSPFAASMKWPDLSIPNSAVSLLDTVYFLSFCGACHACRPYVPHCSASCTAPRGQQPACISLTPLHSSAASRRMKHDLQLHPPETGNSSSSGRLSICGMIAV